MRRPTPAGLVLAFLVLAGLALRVGTLAWWWPATTRFSDSGVYAQYAGSNPLADPEHPAGYPALLALIGVFSREIAVVVVLQYIAGIASALVTYAAVRRLTGSPWPGLLPAAVILLNADEIFLEHTIMSEGAFALALATMFYAAVRALDAPAPWWRWPAAAAALAVLATVIRSAALFVIPVLALVLLLAGPGRWRARWRAPVAVLSVAGALLLAYAGANLVSNGRFEVGPAQGWHLYGRVARFADCRRFTPPKGTERLCEKTPPNRRFGGDFYLFYPASPAERLYGNTPWKKHDSDLRAWAERAIFGQPGTYLLAMWRDFRSWYVPSIRPSGFGAGSDLDPGLEWTTTQTRVGRTLAIPERLEAISLQKFYNPFTVREDFGGVAFLRDYQRVVRFGATALFVATVLCLIGLLVGPRRGRIGVLLFGVGGIALLAAPTLTVSYVGRYAIPLAGPITAGSAIALWALWGLRISSRSSRGRASSVPGE